MADYYPLFSNHFIANLEGHKAQPRQPLFAAVACAMTHLKNLQESKGKPFWLRSEFVLTSLCVFHFFSLWLLFVFPLFCVGGAEGYFFLE